MIVCDILEVWRSGQKTPKKCPKINPALFPSGVLTRDVVDMDSLLPPDEQLAATAPLEDTG